MKNFLEILLKKVESIQFDDFLKHVPGFRSNTKWKLVIALLYYAFCLYLFPTYGLVSFAISLVIPFLFFVIKEKYIDGKKKTIVSKDPIEVKTVAYPRKPIILTKRVKIVFAICTIIILCLGINKNIVQNKADIKKIADKKIITANNDKKVKEKIVADKVIADAKVKADAEAKVMADAKAAADKIIADKKAKAKDKVIADKKAIEDKKIADAQAIADKKNEILTAKNNKELANILAVKNELEPIISEFAEKYIGRTIEFDGNIADMALHGDYKTRYDILIHAGDYSETSAIGPNFKFDDVNTVYDLHITSSNIPENIGTGQKIHIIAKVVEYNENQGLFFLEPISTKMR